MAIRVVAAVVFQKERVLACQRRKNGTFPLKWEFPGGKVERGEGDVSALQRELREELGIEIQSAKEVFRCNHLYPGFTEVELRFFWVEDYRGELANLAFERVLWVEPDTLETLDFLEGDLPLVKKIATRQL